MNRPDSTGIPCISRGLTWNTTHTLKHNVFALHTKKNWEADYPTSFCLAFACTISCCCFSRTSSRLRHPPVNEQTHTWRSVTLSQPHSFHVAPFPKVCACMCCFHQRCWGWCRRKPSLGSAGVPPRRQAPPLPLHSQSQHSTVKRTQQRRCGLIHATGHSLLWMSFLFLGSGGMTVNAVELKKEKHTFVCLLPSARVQLSGVSAPSWESRAD